MMSIVQQSDIPYFYTAHDFSSLCHRNHLVDSEGSYCGQPATDVCRQCVRTDIECVDVVDPDLRRDAYGSFLSGADQVFAPSADTASRLSRVFADLTPKVRSHEEFLPRTGWMTIPNRFVPPLRIAAIGAFGPHKGTSVLHDLALDAKQRKLPIEFTIVGYSHMTDRFRELDVRETGHYDGEAEAMQLLRDCQPLLALFPSIWPETYLYTLSLALAMGIPPVVFDLGAQAERLRAAGVGHVLDPGLIADPGGLNDLLLALPLRDMWRNRRLPAFAVYPRIVEDYYGRAMPESAGGTDAQPADQRQSGRVAR
jgi:glycosyltransferase involved in cell wall biosynthesis